MRYIVSIALILTACTKPNPDAIGGGAGNGGIGGGGAAGSGGTGGGGGTGGTGGVGGGGGGSGGSIDMSMPKPADMRVVPPDMTSLVGVFCGSMSCVQSDCCINNTGDHCVTNGCTNGPIFTCDGPEDCTGPNVAPDCCLQNMGAGTKPSGSGCMLASDPACFAILCHSESDCPAGSGYVACCALPNLPYKRCSKAACL